MKPDSLQHSEHSTEAPFLGIPEEAFKGEPLELTDRYTMRVAFVSRVRPHLPDMVRSQLDEWLSHRDKKPRYMTISMAPEIYAKSDRDYFAYDTRKQKGVAFETGGEFRGPLGVMPGRKAPLPQGALVLEMGFIGNEPYIQLHQGTAERPIATKALDTPHHQIEGSHLQ